MLGFSGMEVSLVAPGGSPFVHQHRQHEVYLFIQGHGQFQVDDEILEVGPGTVMRVEPEGPRPWRLNSQVYFIMQTNVGPLTSHNELLVSDP